MYTGPNIITDGLVMCLDAANKKGISPLGNNLFNGASELAKNLISPNDLVQALNGVHIGNLDYYTAFAIDYPESSFGGDAAGRQGITQGLNVRSGSKIFGYSRALHYSVFDNLSKTWVKHTIYDSYVGTGPVDTFVSEYATAVSNYPNAIHVVAGSHRDSYHTTAQYNILRDLGAPSNVDSIIGFSSPEWILVGKPGLGAGNAYGWVFQNYTTNPSQVAHLNFGLPIYGNASNYFLFDGTNDYMNIGNASTFLYNGVTSVNIWLTTNSLGSYKKIFFTGDAGTSNIRGIYFSIGGSPYNTYFGVKTNIGMDLANYSVDLPLNTFVNLCGTYDGLNIKLYLNGNLVATQSLSGLIGNEGIGRISGYDNNNEIWDGKMALFQIYDRALSAEEVKQNYNTTKSRFGL